MPIQITCPSCQSVLKVKGTLKGTPRCPKCGEPIPLDNLPPPPDEPVELVDDVEEVPAKPVRKSPRLSDLAEALSERKAGDARTPPAPPRLNPGRSRSRLADDRPRRTGSASDRSSGGGLIILLGLALTVFLVLVGVAGGVAMIYGLAPATPTPVGNKFAFKGGWANPPAAAPAWPPPDADRGPGDFARGAGEAAGGFGPGGGGGFGPAAPPGPPPPPAKLPPIPPAVPIGVAPLTNDRGEYKLPGTVDALTVGGGGRFLVLHMKDRNTVGIFDTNEAKIVRYIGLAESGAQMAAGMTKLIIYFPTAKVIRCYDLLKDEPPKTVKFEGPNQITAFCMGSASDGPLLVAGGEDNRFGGGPGGNAPPKSGFYDISTFERIEVPEQNELAGGAAGPRGPGAFWGGFSGKFWPAANGRVFGNSGGGFGDSRIVSIDGGVMRIHGGLRDGWFMRPSADGKYAFPGGFGILSRDLKAVPDAPYSNIHNGGSVSNTYLPALFGPYFMHVGTGVGVGNFGQGPEDVQGQVDVYMVGYKKPILTLKHLKQATYSEWEVFTRAGMSFDQSIHLIPQAKLLAVLPATRDRLYLYRADLDEALDRSGLEYLLVVSQPPASAKKGKELTYQMVGRAKKGPVTFKLDAGPAGMTVTPQGLLKWPVPANFNAPQVDVIVTAKDTAGQETFHTFPLHIKEANEADDAPPPPPPPPPAPSPPKNVYVPPAVRPERPIEGVEITLAGKVDRVVPGAGGRFLIMHLMDKKLLAVLDVNTVRVVKEIPVEGEHVDYAANATHLLVFMLSAKKVQRWELAGMKLEADLVLPEWIAKQPPKDFLCKMGSASQGPLVVHIANMLKTFVLDPLTLDDNEIRWQNWRPNGGAAGPNFLWMSADGSTLFAGNGGWAGEGVVKFVDGLPDNRKEHATGGDLKHGSVTPDGQFIFTNDFVISPSITVIDRILKGWVFAANEPGWYVKAEFGPNLAQYYPAERRPGVDPGRSGRLPRTRPPIRRPIPGKPPVEDKPVGVTIGLTHARTTTVSIPLPDLDPDIALPPDQRVHYYPTVSLLVYVAKDDRVVFRRLDFAGEISKKPGDALFVPSAAPSSAKVGQEYRYPLLAQSKSGSIKYTLDEAPAGMTLDASGIIVWTPKAEHTATIQRIAVTLEDGKQTLKHIFRVAVPAN